MNLPLLSYIWVGLAIAFALAELLQPFFGYSFAALAGLAAAVSAGLGLHWEYQCLVFAIALAVGLLLLRPRLLHYLQSKHHLPSRTDLLIGKRARVTDAIDPLAGKGRIEVEGQDWAAASQAAIPVDSTVIVESADGIVLNVKRGE